METNDEVFLNLALEFRRGTIVIAALGALQSRRHYGYSLLQELESFQLPIEGNTLYPLLRRLEKQGVLRSTWDTSENRPRKYYELTPEGETLYKRLTKEWKEINLNVRKIIKE